MPSTQTLARITAVFYLIMAISSAYGLKIMEGFETGDAATVIHHIQAKRFIYQLCIASSAIAAISYLILAYLLHRLFSPISNIAASLLAIFVVVGVAVMMVAIAKQLDILSLLDGFKFGMTHRAASDRGLPIFSGEQLQTQVTLALYAYDNLLVASCLFWGLWLIPMGWLMFRSGGIAPMVIGILLVLGGIGYMMGFIRPVLFPDFKNALYQQASFIILGIPSFTCELATMLYLLIMGAPGRARTAALARS